MTETGTAGGMIVEKIGIISTRLGGIDGVSIESGKWAQAYRKLGLEPVLIAGNNIKETAFSHYTIRELDFSHGQIEDIRVSAFNTKTLTDFELTRLRKSITGLKNSIKLKLGSIAYKTGINAFSIENALSIPLNIPLGIALGEYITENSINTITRHHDFFWEREEFLNSKVADILEVFFPPDFKTIKHVVINSIAQKSLWQKKNIKAVLIPNVFDFSIPDKPDLKNPERVKGLRDFLGITPADYLFLQPTRIIRRKNIERSIDIADMLKKELGLNIYILISGLAEKHEIEYFYHILDYSSKKGISLILCNSFNHRGRMYLNVIIKKVFRYYSIYDLYNACDLVTLPSDVEGFGNPVIEAAAFKKPLFVNNYPVLGDFLAKGFDFIVFDKVISRDCIEKIIRTFKDRSYRESMLERNYQVAREHYSYRLLVKKLKNLLAG